MIRSRMTLACAATAACTLVSGCAHRQTRADAPTHERAINRVLDDWHAAASEADLDRYFGHMTRDAVFMGTDASERWTRDAFIAYARPHFDAGRGWTYTSVERHVRVHESGDVAWFDERLLNEKLGECRGTGVLVRGTDGIWRIAHDSLTIPIPNDIALDVAEQVRRVSSGSEQRP